MKSWLCMSPFFSQFKDTCFWSGLPLWSHLWVSGSDSAKIFPSPVQSSTYMIDSKSRPKASFQLNFRNNLCWSPVVGLWQRSLIWKIESHQDSDESSGHWCHGSTDSRKVCHGDSIPYMLQSTTSSTSSSSIVQVGTFPRFKFSGEALLQ